MNDSAFIADAPPPRRSAAQVPLEVWLRALLVTLVCTFALGGWFAWGRTPMPVAVDSALYARQFANLDRQLADLRKNGQKPLSIVFLGTSRIRNVTLDADHVAQSAKTAGIARPVASTVIGVNWGGFERFAPALPMITARRPDLVVIMPELLSEDFTLLTRARMGKSWLQAWLWGKNYSPFATDETTLKVCIGFDQKPAERDAEFRDFVVPNSTGWGPRAAREFVAGLASSGSRVIVTDVPVTSELAALRPPLAEDGALLGKLGLGAVRNVGTVVLGSRFARSSYCDYAHLDPAHDRDWQQTFFSVLAANSENGLGD